MDSSSVSGRGQAVDDFSNPLYGEAGSSTIVSTSLPTPIYPSRPAARKQGKGSNESKWEAGSTISTADKPRSTKATLHAKLGGAAAVSAAVDIFYRKLIADEMLKPFFENVDVLTLIAKQNRFLAYAFGATSHYHGKDIVMSHAHLIINKGLDLSHFDKVAGHFADTLHELKVPQELIDESTAVLLGVRPLFDPVRYKGKIDVDKIERSAGVPATKGSGQTPSRPACECCVIS